MLAIVLLTYNRFDYARETMTSTLRHLITTEDIHVHIASDGDDTEYIDGLKVAVNAYTPNITTSNVNRLGYGASYNVATQVVHNLPNCEYVLPLEDDWRLLKPFNIDPMLRALSIFGCIRMGYIGYTQELRCTFVAHEGNHYLHLDPDSAEPHVFAGHPRVETVGWERSVGPWEEGLLPGQTEWQVAHRPAARRNVAWPISAIKPEGDAWVHIGAVRSY